MDVNFLCFVLTGLFCCTQSTAVRESTPKARVVDAPSYARLLDDLLYGNAELRRNTPPFNEEGLVIVKYGLYLLDVHQASARTGVVELLVWEHMSWNDNRMMWDPEMYGGILNVRMPQSMIWKPDIMTYNSFTTEEIKTRSEVNVVLSNEGNISYIPPSYKKIRCGINENRTVASCKLKIGSYTFSGNQIDLDFYGEEGLDLSYLHTSRLVPRVVNNNAKKNMAHYPGCSEPYPDLTFTFDIVLDGESDVEE